MQHVSNTPRAQSRQQLAAACGLTVRQLNYRLRLYFPELAGRYIKVFTPNQVAHILETLQSA